ncbi:MAG TPA: hypothetical protein VHU77_12750, partial [Candidatus Limnocylindria bacterium]|nr:hypothetical protein [Candidatus Limnocylindria bacterium]
MLGAALLATLGRAPDPTVARHRHDGSGAPGADEVRAGPAGPLATERTKRGPTGPTGPRGRLGPTGPDFVPVFVAGPRSAALSTTTGAF